MIKAAIYARYSSNQQREESIDAQLRACRKHCKEHGYIVVKEYVDRAESGRYTTNRTAYLQMKSDAKKKLFEVAVFHKIDRNARDEYSYYSTKIDMLQLGIRQEYSGQPIDTSTPEGQLMENNLVGFAAFYSRNLARETKKGLNENAYKAQFNGGYTPLGYSIDTNKKYVVNPLEAPIIETIFEMFVSGNSYSTIIDALNQKGYTTRKGKQFGKNSLHDILANPKYMGTYTFNSTCHSEQKKRNTHSTDKASDFIEIKGAIPAIVSEETFSKAQDRLQSRVRESRIMSDSDYILSGFLRCGECGSAMVGHSLTSHGKKYRYYTCAKKERGHKCTSRYLPKEALEKEVMEYIIDKVFSPANLQTIFSEYVAEVKANPQKNKEALKKAMDAEASLKRKLNNLYSALENGGIDDFDMERIQNIKSQLKTAQNRIAEERERENISNIPEEYVFRKITSFLNKLETKKDPHVVRAFLESSVERITVYPDELVFSFAISVVLQLVPRSEPTIHTQQILRFNSKAPRTANKNCCKRTCF